MSSGVGVVACEAIHGTFRGGEKTRPSLRHCIIFLISSCRRDFEKLARTYRGCFEFHALVQGVVRGVACNGHAQTDPVVSTDVYVVGNGGIDTHESVLADIAKTRDADVRSDEAVVANHRVMAD